MFGVEGAGAGCGGDACQLSRCASQRVARREPLGRFPHESWHDDGWPMARAPCAGRGRQHHAEAARIAGSLRARHGSWRCARPRRAGGAGGPGQPRGQFRGHPCMRRDREPWQGRAALLRGVAGAVRCLRAVDRAAEGFALKWPNDVLLNGGKLAGILLERRAGRTCHLAIGIGVNLARRRPGTGGGGRVAPVSLRETGVRVTPEDFSTCWRRPMRTRGAVHHLWFRADPRRMAGHAARLGEVITARTMPRRDHRHLRDGGRSGQSDLNTPKGAVPSRRPTSFSKGRRMMLLAIDCGNTNTVFSIWDGRHSCAPAHVDPHARTAEPILRGSRRW